MAAISFKTNWENPHSVANRQNFYNSYNAGGTSGTGTIPGLVSAYGKNTAATNTKAQSFLVNAKENAGSLSEVLKKLKNGGAFNEKTVVSSNTETVSVKASDAKKAADFKETSIRVDQVALAQKNSGKEMTATGRDFTVGQKTFEIETASGTTSISFYVSGSDTNADVQKKMAEAINSKKIGVTASVSTANGKTTLSVESAATGVKTEGSDNFKIKDTATGGGVAQAAGITQVSVKAQDAVYSLNGGASVKSKTNSVDLGNGVTATLKKASEEPVKVGFGTDTKSGINAVREMVNYFNGLFEAAQDNKDDRRTGFLNQRLQSLPKTYENSLKELGITRNSKGYLQIDEAAMQSAADSGKLEKFFKPEGGFVNYGFNYQLEKMANDVSKNTQNFVSAAQTSRDTSHLTYIQDMRYGQLVSKGLLFESLF